MRGNIKNPILNFEKINTGLFLNLKRQKIKVVLRIGWVVQLIFLAQ